MHPNSRFHWQDHDEIAAFVADIGFGMLFAGTPDGPRVVHIPAVIRDGILRFHVSRGNAITRHLGGRDALFVVNGPDAYISPDWYAQTGYTDVPTWNYLAVELEGPVRALPAEALPALLDEVVATFEVGGDGKAPWTVARSEPGYLARLMRGIAGFEMDIRAWRGTAKLSQDKAPEMRQSVIDNLEATGRTAVAHLIREWPCPGD